MDQEILKILPLAVAAAVNPMGICVLIAVLSSNRKAATGILLGFVAAFVAFGVVVLALGLHVSSSHPGPVSAIIDLVAAAALFALAVRNLLKRHEDAAGDRPEKTRRQRRLGLATGLVTGLVLAATDVSSLIPYGIALKDLSIAQLSGAELALGDVVFLLICLAPMIIPVVLTYTAPRAAERVLDPLNRTLKKHGNTITAVVLIVLAAYLAVKGARAL
jgi:threonine/homoserine/homoserine lactone efflux protein